MTKQCEVCGTTEGEIYGINSEFKMNLCVKHYYQMRRHRRVLKRTIRDPNKFIIHGDTVEIVMYDNHGNESGSTTIDTKYYDKVKDYKWYLHSSGYVFGKVNGVINKLHRFILGVPKDMYVDHINHNTLDNREVNLRICTNQENSMNTRIRKNNTSGHKGVCWSKQKGKWRAYITLNRQISLGLYSDINDAIAAREAAEKKYFGEFRYQKDVSTDVV